MVTIRGSKIGKGLGGQVSKVSKVTLDLSPPHASRVRYANPLGAQPLDVQPTWPLISEEPISPAPGGQVRVQTPEADDRNQGGGGRVAGYRPMDPWVPSPQGKKSPDVAGLGELDSGPTPAGTPRQLQQ